MTDKVIICFGDSVTYGQGVQRGEDFPSLLGRMTGRTVINAGVPGDTTADGLKRLGKDVLRRRPHLVVIELGANDYFHGVPVEEVMRNLGRIISGIQSVGAMVALCDLSGDRYLDRQHDIYHCRLKDLAKKTGSVFIPRLMRGIIRKPSLRLDTFHPNALGYTIIAERIYKAIRRNV